MSDKEKSQIEKQGSTRRTFLKNSDLAVGGLILGGAVGSMIDRNSESGVKTRTESRAEANNPNEALMFFIQKNIRRQRQLQNVFSEGLIFGPGAYGIKCGDRYIDHQTQQWGGRK